MKKLFIMFLLASVLVISGATSAMGWGDYNDNRRNYNHHNTVDSPSADANANVDNTNNNNNVNANMNQNSNNNTNTNINVSNAEGGNATIEEGAVNNDNTNKQQQGQVQGQLQGQNQNQTSNSNVKNSGNSNQSQSVENSGNSNQSQSNSINIEASKTKRNMPNSVLPSFPEGPSYFSDAPMTEEFMSIKDLARLNAEWTAVSVKSFAGWHNSTDFEDVEYKERILYSFHDSSEKVKITFGSPQQHKRWQFVGMLTAKAKEGVDMGAVVSVILQGAIDNGANLIYPINQGAKRVLTASSVGVALGYTHVVIGGGNERTAGAGTAGIGWSKGTTSYSHEPFLRVGIYKVSDEEYKNIKTFPNGFNTNDVLKQKVIELQKKVQQYQKESETR